MYFRKSSILITSMFYSRVVALRTERIIIVGRMTAYDNDKEWLFGEFQATDRAEGNTFAAPRLKLGDTRRPENSLLFNTLADEFDGNDSNPVFFGFRLFEQPGSTVFEYERFQ